MNIVDRARSIRQGEELDLAAVATYLRSVIPDLEGPVGLQQFPSGASNLTYLLRFGDREMVLRRPPFGRKAKSAHDMSREVRTLTALEGIYPYVPKVLDYCDDPAVIGCDFYVMERIEGIILRRNLPRELALSSDQISQLCRNVIDRLIDLHSIDYEAAGLADFGKPSGYVKRQIEGWSERYVQARTPNAPSFERVREWLHARMPGETRVGIIHGDYRFDNVVLDPRQPLEVIGVLDWEMATLGDPLMDLGNSLAYWIERRDPLALRLFRLQPTHLDGMLTREEVVSYYCEKTGVACDCFDFYRVYGLFRLVVIMQQIYFRFYHRQTRNRRFGRFIYLIKYLEKYLNRLIDASRL
jgi:aminoglycoside phosphotransferase (APT) family kinase protein